MVSVSFDKDPTDNRPVQATAFSCLPRGQLTMAPSQRSPERLQRLSWTDPNMHRAPLERAPSECEWKHGENLLAARRTRAPDAYSAGSGVRFAHAVSAAFGRKGGHLSGPPPVSPLDRFAITLPRQPHLPRLLPPRVSIPARWQRSSGPSPGRGPPRRSEVDFSGLLMEAREPRPASGALFTISPLATLAPDDASYRLRKPQRVRHLRQLSPAALSRPHEAAFRLTRLPG